ncbi:MAG: MOSC domain-containing protein [Dehalococcoidia bacterium]
MPKVYSIQICKSHRSPMEKAEQAKLISNLGIEGDIHSSNKGKKKNRQILLMDIETLNSFNLTTGIIKENITTQGLKINNLKLNQKIHIGESVILTVSGPCEPCPRMDEIRPGLMKDIDGQRGTLASVENGGIIKVGDKIEII